MALSDWSCEESSPIKDLQTLRDKPNTTSYPVNTLPIVFMPKCMYVLMVRRLLSGSEYKPVFSRKSAIYHKRKGRVVEKICSDNLVDINHKPLYYWRYKLDG